MAGPAPEDSARADDSGGWGSRGWFQLKLHDASNPDEVEFVIAQVKRSIIFIVQPDANL
jgi:hypothetical protein